MIRIAICDDEDSICSNIETYVSNSCKVLNTKFEIDIFNSGESLIQHIKTQYTYNLLFLDIELYKYNGIDVSNFIRNIFNDDAMQIVYVSGKNQYDRQLFTFRPFDFIAKPFTEKQFFTVIEKYLRIYGNKNKMFHYKYGHDSYWVKLDDIIYFRSIDRKVLIKQLTTEEDFYGSLDSVANELSEQGFFSPHKSYLINYKYIRTFRHDTIVMSNLEEIPIARGKRKEVARIQLDYENGGSDD